MEMYISGVCAICFGPEDTSGRYSRASSVGTSELSPLNSVVMAKIKDRQAGICMAKPFFAFCLAHNKGRVKYPAMIQFEAFWGNSVGYGLHAGAFEVQTMFRPLFLAR